MTTATKEKQSLLQEFGIKREAVRRLVDTVEIHHQAAYTQAALKHLKDKEGNLDYKMLENADVRSAMADQMADYYEKEARNYFRNADAKLSDMQKEQLIHAYAGITRGQLKTVIHQEEAGFNLQRFGRLVGGIKERIGEQLGSSAYAHIKDTAEHKHDIIKDLGLEGKVDSSLIRLDELIPLMEEHHERGAVAPATYKKLPAYKATQAKGGGAPSPAHH